VGTSYLSPDEPQGFSVMMRWMDTGFVTLFPVAGAASFVMVLCNAFLRSLRVGHPMISTLPMTPDNFIRVFRDSHFLRFLYFSAEDADSSSRSMLPLPKLYILITRKLKFMRSAALLTRTSAKSTTSRDIRYVRRRNIFANEPTLNSLV
jgi:hypothetical protein